MTRLPLAGALVVLALATGSARAAGAQSFVPPSDGTLYIQCVGGTGAATSQFGTGTTPGNFKPLFTNLPRGCPTAEVPIRVVAEGDAVVFAIRTEWTGVEWAFSNRSDPASTIAFTDKGNTLGMGGSVVQQTGPNTWVMHLDDAASYLVDDNNADVLIQVRFVPDGPPPATPAVR